MKKNKTIKLIDGVELAVSSVGFKYKNRLDYFLARLAKGTTVAGIFTKSDTRSAAVDYSRQALINKNVRLIIANSGNANAFSGKKGFLANEALSDLSKKLAFSKEELKTDISTITTSTGVIGEVLDISPLKRLEKIKFDASFSDCAKAIMTTDTHLKLASRQTTIAGRKIQISAIAKGSGMIAPNMATMLSYIFTDAYIDSSTLQQILLSLSDESFNLISVDGDTSTSDSVILAATGKAGGSANDDLTDFITALKAVFIDLAKQIVKDGEGATKLISITVRGARSFKSAKTVAMSIANSPLVKTAIGAGDANWGRIIMAIGKSFEQVLRHKISISIAGIPIAKLGEIVETTASKLKIDQHLKTDEIFIEVDLNIGRDSCTVWTCDLSKRYIDINADYIT